MFSIILSSVLIPLITSWTFGEGFLAKLYFEDQTACISLNLITGIIAFVASYVVKPRLGRYKPISIKKNFMLSTHNDSMLSTNQIEIQKEQLEQLSEMMPIDFYEKSKNVHETILKIQKVVKYSEIDGFFNRNSNILCYVGTVMMMVSLPVV